MQVHSDRHLMSFGVPATPRPSARSILFVIMLLALVGLSQPTVGGAYASVENPLGTRVTPGFCPPSWTQVDSPNAGDGDNALVAAAGTSSTDLWAVGYSKDPGSAEAHTLTEHWDGQSWTVLTSPNVAGVSNYLEGVQALAPDDVWAVGWSQLEVFPGSDATTLTEHWDGQSWTIVPSPNQGTDDSNYLHAVKGFSPTDVWAIGEGYIDGINTAITLHWDGSEWVVVPGPKPPHTYGDWLYAVDGTSPTDIWAVGYFFDLDVNYNQPLFAHWDGTVWSTYDFKRLQTELHAQAVVAIATNDVWSVGRTGSDPNYSGLSGQHWDGTEWTEDVPLPRTQGDLNILSSLTALSSADVWTAGYYTDRDTGAERLLLEHWDGESSDWTAVDTPDVGDGDARLGGITAVPGVSELWSIGSLTDPGTGALRTLTLQDCPIGLGDQGFFPSGHG